MVDEKGKVHAEIAAVLDMALIEQQIEAGVYDIENCLRFVSSKMLQLCAPVRDAAIRELATLTDIPSAMQAMLSILDDMKLDLANYRLLQLRPHLMKQAVEYEQSKFQSALDEGVITLAKTTEWLQAAAKMAQEVADARNPEGIAIPDNRVRFQAVYYDALLALLFGAEPLMRETVPETLIMDAERMSSMQNELQAMSIVGALVLLSQQVFPQMRGDAALLKQLKAELLVLLEAPDTTVEHIAALIVSKANVVLERTGKPAVDEERVKLVESMVNKTMSLNDTIYSLINRRMRDAIRAYLVSGKWSIGPNSGLDMVAVELEAIAAKTMRLGRHNAAVHEPQYNEVIRTALNL